MLKNATVDHTFPEAPAKRIKSQAREKIQRPMGKTISMGWMGCLKMLAGVRIGDLFLILRHCESDALPESSSIGIANVALRLSTPQIDTRYP
jgi:hypothetical protein